MESSHPRILFYFDYDFGQGGLCLSDYLLDCLHNIYKVATISPLQTQISILLNYVLMIPTCSNQSLDGDGMVMGELAEGADPE